MQRHGRYSTPLAHRRCPSPRRAPTLPVQASGLPLPAPRSALWHIPGPLGVPQHSPLPAAARPSEGRPHPAPRTQPLPAAGPARALPKVRPGGDGAARPGPALPGAALPGAALPAPPPTCARARRHAGPWGARPRSRPRGLRRPRAPPPPPPPPCDAGRAPPDAEPRRGGAARRRGRGGAGIPDPGVLL